MPTKSVPYSFSTKNADFCNTEKNFFTVRLNNPIDIPLDALDCEIALHSSTIWNSSPNIITAANKLYVIYNSINYILVIPQGLYSLDHLQSSLAELLVQNSLPADLFVLSGNETTQKIKIQYNYVNCQINFIPNDSIFHILGFNQRISPIGPVDQLLKFDISDNTANFNQVNGYFILCESLVNNGVSLNASSYSILGQIPIISPPNSIINYETRTPLYICCNHLLGKKIYDLDFRILSTDLKPVTIVEDWSFTIMITTEYGENRRPPPYF
jgi:hypothetical protein